MKQIKNLPISVKRRGGESSLRGHRQKSGGRSRGLGDPPGLKGKPRWQVEGGSGKLAIVSGRGMGLEA